MKDIRRLKREESAVSPVIATILMVAITVVLAATLWMMLDTGDNGDMPLSASIRGELDGEEEDVVVTFTSLGRPSRTDIGNVEFVISHGDGETTVWGDSDDVVSWRLLTGDGDVRSSSEARIDFSEEGLDNVESVTVFIDGYEGSRTSNF